MAHIRLIIYNSETFKKLKERALCDRTGVNIHKAYKINTIFGQILRAQTKGTR